MECDKNHKDKIKTQ